MNVVSIFGAVFVTCYLSALTLLTEYGIETLLLWSKGHFVDIPGWACFLITLFTGGVSGTVGAIIWLVSLFV